MRCTAKVHDERAYECTRGLRLGHAPGRFSASESLGRGQGDNEFAPEPNTAAMYRYAPIVQLHDGPHDCQSQPEPALCAIGSLRLASRVSGMKLRPSR